MRILITASDLIDRGLWDEVCEARGINVWAVNEGLMDADEEFIFTQKEATSLGLLPRGDAARDEDSDEQADS